MTVTWGPSMAKGGHFEHCKWSGGPSVAAIHGWGAICGSHTWSGDLQQQEKLPQMVWENDFGGTIGGGITSRLEPIML